MTCITTIMFLQDTQNKCHLLPTADMLKKCGNARYIIVYLKFTNEKS